VEEKGRARHSRQTLPSASRRRRARLAGALACQALVLKFNN
jgi:hypothetical protein